MCVRCHAEVRWQPSCMRHLELEEQCHRWSVASKARCLHALLSAAGPLVTPDAHSAGVPACTLHALRHARGSSGTTHVFVFTLTISSRKVYGPAPDSFGPQPMNIRMMWGFLGWITAACAVRARSCRLPLH